MNYLKKENIEVYKKAIEFFGVKRQLIAVIEELSELQVEMSKILNSKRDLGVKEDREKIVDELADGYIMATQTFTTLDLHIELIAVSLMPLPNDLYGYSQKPEYLLLKNSSKIIEILLDYKEDATEDERHILTVAIHYFLKSIFKYTDKHCLDKEVQERVQIKLARLATLIEKKNGKL